MSTPIESATDTTSPIAIGDAGAALEAASAFSGFVGLGASARDRAAAPPLAQLNELSRSGLLAVGVPKAYGGAEVSCEVTTEIVRGVAQADPSIAQILLVHFVVGATILHRGSEEQKRRFFGEMLSGRRFGNAITERGTSGVFEWRTRVEPLPQGGWRIDGRKHYATGAIGAAWILVVGRGPTGEAITVLVEPHRGGVELDLEEWSSFGQRGTFSGVVALDAVVVPDAQVITLGLGEDSQLVSPLAQLLHAAIETGIARGALLDGVEHILKRTRPWHGSGVDSVVEEQHVVVRLGELETRVLALEALLSRAAVLMSRAAAGVTPTAQHEASIAVAAAKALAQAQAVAIASEVLELAGGSASDERYGLDRHWRNARVHSIHDPVRWRYHAVGLDLLARANQEYAPDSS